MAYLQHHSNTLRSVILLLPKITLIEQSNNPKFQNTIKLWESTGVFDTIDDSAVINAFMQSKEYQFLTSLIDPVFLVGVQINPSLLTLHQTVTVVVRLTDEQYLFFKLKYC